MAQPATQAPPQDFLLSELPANEQAFIAKVRSFAEDYVLPNTRAWESARAFPNDIWTTVGKMGLLGLAVPKNLGGLGYSVAAYCWAIKEIARADPALAMNLAAANALSVGHLVHFASKEQQAKYLQGAMEGTIRLSWSLTEPNAGSDARMVQSKAAPIEERPGFFHLNGEKMFITNGGTSDLTIVFAQFPEGQVTAFLMETDQPGFQPKRRIDTVGVCASNTLQYEMHDAVAWHTPCSFADCVWMLQRGRLGIAGMAVGIAEKAMELTVEYSKQRMQFNRRLADMQSVQNMIADSLTEIEASWLLTLNGSKKLETGVDCARESSMAKLFASETANRATDHAIQIHGGRGMTPDYLVEKLWRDAKLTEIGEGASEIQRLVISKLALK